MCSLKAYSRNVHPKAWKRDVTKRLLPLVIFRNLIQDLQFLHSCIHNSTKTNLKDRKCKYESPHWLAWNTNQSASLCSETRLHNQVPLNLTCWHLAVALFLMYQQESDIPFFSSQQEGTHSPKCPPALTSTLSLRSFNHFSLSILTKSHPYFSTSSFCLPLSSPPCNSSMYYWNHINWYEMNLLPSNWNMLNWKWHEFSMNLPPSPLTSMNIHEWTHPSATESCHGRQPIQPVLSLSSLSAPFHLSCPLSPLISSLWHRSVFAQFLLSPFILLTLQK